MNNKNNKDSGCRLGRLLSCCRQPNPNPERPTEAPAQPSAPLIINSPIKPNGFVCNFPMPARRRPKPPATPEKCLLGELDSMLYDHQRAVGGGALVRVTSSNVMVLGHLGNLRGNLASSSNHNVLRYLPNTVQKVPSSNADAKNSDGILEACDVEGRMVKNTTKEPPAVSAKKPPLFRRVLSRKQNRKDSEKLGNEAQEKGMFAESLALRDNGSVTDPVNAMCWIDKASELTGVGRLLEAADACKEAIRIEPSNCRAHHQLATLYFRLGEAERAFDHFKLSRSEASSTDISKVQALRTHLLKCIEARKLGNWNNVLKEAQCAISVGADSATQVFALQSEALLKLDRHDEAESTFKGALKFDIDASTKFFGATKTAHITVIRAEIEMAAGRFQDAIRIAQMAAQLDPSNREASVMVRRTRAVASARSRGNDLFKASKFGEACAAYGAGLDHTPRNAILLCNRAACRSNLGQWERALEDCNAALSARPSYIKARLRRAKCNSKLERWEASMSDYEVLLNEIPGDDYVIRALSEAQDELKKKRRNHVRATSLP